MKLLNSLVNGYEKNSIKQSILALIVCINFLVVHTFSMELAHIQPNDQFAQAMGDLKILSVFVANIQGDHYLETLAIFRALNRVNKHWNTILSTPSIVHQIVYKLADECTYYDEIDIAKSMKNMKGLSHPAFARWLETRTNQRVLEESLFKAASSDDSEIIRKLIEEEKVNSNARSKHGKTAVSIAASMGANKALAQLLVYNPDVNLPNKHGWTPLKKAADGAHVHSERRIDSVELLLQDGATVDQADNEGYTPLMNAYECPEILKLLIAKKANVNHQAKDGRTTLMFAVYNAKLDAVRLLIAAGARDDVYNREGRNARDIARDRISSGYNYQICLNILEAQFGKNEK